MRQKVGAGNWSSAIRIVGETGSAGHFVDHVFKRAAAQPATPTGDGTPAGWSDAPPAGTDPLWMSVAEKTAADVLVGSWAAPVRLDGAAGTPGGTGDSVSVNYSADATNWHADFTAGDLYMRQKVGAGSWSSAIRIVGEKGETGTSIKGDKGDDGGFVDYVFQRNQAQPSTPTGNGTPSGWFDEPPAGTDPLWFSTATKTAANVLVGSWSAAIRIEGPAGAGIATQYSVDASNWHSSFTAGDLYMRQQIGSGGWSASMRIVGENGYGGGNLCRNGDFAEGFPTGWEWNNGGLVTLIGANKIDYTVNGGVGVGAGTGFMWQLDDWTNTGYSEAYSDPIPVVPGKRWCVSAYTGALRCRVDVFAYCYNSAGSIISQFGAGADENDEAFPGGVLLSSFKRHQQTAIVSADTSYIRLTLRKYATKPAYSNGPNSYAFFARAQAEAVGDNQTTAGPWAIPGPTAGSINTGKIAAGAVTQSGQIFSNGLTLSNIT